MSGGGWLCLLSPLAGTLAILLGGTRLPRRAAAWIGRVFLTAHLLAFEITSIVLLVAAVGGVILGAHTRRQPPPLETTGEAG